jgi:hypothetical protein
VNPEHRWRVTLVNTCLDYLKADAVWNVCAGFLQAMSERPGYWCALLRADVRWWRACADTSSADASADVALGRATSENDDIALH